MGGHELKYVHEAFETNWIAPYGPSINAFEKEMAAYMGVESALALTSGTGAIHLALRWVGVKQGDTVFCQDFTLLAAATRSCTRKPTRCLSTASRTLGT